MMGCKRHQTQRGQVLPFATVFLALCAGLFLFMTNAGQMTVEKTRALNAADAAAYSAGVVQARGLNFAAYSNRAMVANQVAIAQALTLTNTINYFGSAYSATDYTASGAFASGVGYASVPNPANTRAMERYVKLSSLLVGSWVAQYYGVSPVELLEYLKYFDMLGSAMISISNIASEGLRIAEMAAIGAQGAQLWVQSSAVAERVASEMDPQLEASVAPWGALSEGIGSIVKSYEDDERTRQQSIVLDSLQAPIKHRDWDVKQFVTFLASGMYRRGGTSMPDLDHWEAHDRLYSQSFSLRWWGIRTNTEDIAYANSRIGTDSDAPSADYYYLSYSKREFEDDEFFAQYSGMPSMYDIKDPDNKDAVQHRAGVTAYVHKKKQDTHTSGHHADMAVDGQFNIFGERGGDRLAGIARAEVLFDAPPRADGRQEYPNLFNPFWTTRLVDLSAADYAAVILSRIGGHL